MKKQMSCSKCHDKFWYIDLREPEKLMSSEELALLLCKYCERDIAWRSAAESVGENNVSTPNK